MTATVTALDPYQHRGQHPDACAICHPIDHEAPSNRFEVGCHYDTGRGDYSWTFTVEARTAKFVTMRQVDSGETFRVGVYLYDGEEHALPFGRYSQAPVVAAGRKVVPA